MCRRSQRFASLFLPLLSLLLLPVFTASAGAQDVTGDWYGILDVGAARLRLALHVEAAEGGYTATLDSPDQGASGIPLDEFLVEESRVVFRLTAAGLEYEGRLDPAFTEIIGTFSQGGRASP